MISRALLDRYYPPAAFDGTKRFYDLVRRHVSRDMVVLNMGCGPASGNPVKILKGEVAKVVGADIDPAAASNGDVDEVAIYDGRRLPFEDGSFDAAYADFVMEHLERPEESLREIRRVVRPGGTFLFRTPNRNHYVALASRLVPDRWKESVANRTRGFGGRENRTYPVYYRFNSRGDVDTIARRAGFGKDDIAVDFVECEPSYLAFSLPTFLLGLAYERLVNASDSLGFLRANIFGVLTRR